MSQSNAVHASPRQAIRPRHVIACALLLALPACWLWPAGTVPAGAQSTSSFEGQVTDVLSGEPMAGAVVSAGGLQTTTDSRGRYAMLGTPGLYEIRVRADRYIGMSMTRQRLRSGAITRVDFSMIPASPSPQQRAALDQIFAQRPGPQLSAQELDELREDGFAPSTLTQLPATIRVLMPDGIVVVMSLDEYVKGVLPREMPPYWPPEALKAQAVAARCYAVTGRRHADVGADVCTTEHCQVWGPVHYETTDRAVDQTHNVAATYAGSIIRAFFFAHCNGHTHNSEDVWQAALPYCRSVACPCGFEAFYGHGVGMCQQGARVLAEQGRSYAEILAHYYSHVQVAALAPPSLSQARVYPERGDTATIFTYEVLYEGSDPPIVANLYIDGHTFDMTAVPSAVSAGRLYRYSTALAVGAHTYAFRFEDGYSDPVVLPATGTFSGPEVELRDSTRPTPTPTPEPGGTQGWRWTQSTVADFAQGVGQDTQFSRSGDGELTLAADQTYGVYTSTLKLAPIEFVAVGSSWLATQPPGTDLQIELRSSSDGGSWSDWQVVPPMDAERDVSLLDHGELIYTPGPYLQYRLILSSSQTTVSPVLSSISLVCIDSRSGPTASQALAISLVPPDGAPVIVSRAAWGADESLFDWPPEYRPVRKFVVHHTATPNGDLDPAATVRAIYYYHTVTRGWGDIGYNYLIDTQGRVYEGRKGGEGVVGGHAKQYAWGSIGLSFIGNYDEVELPAAAEESATELIAWKGNLHFVDPTGHGFFIDQDLPNVMGHRDGSQTTCPGRYAYARLPSIRQAALARMPEIAPNVRIDSPIAGAQVGGVVEWRATASPAVNRVEFYVDGVLEASDSSAPFSWNWNAQRASEGPHQLRVRARNAIGLEAEHVISVTVDHGPPAGSLSGPAFTNSLTVTLTTPVDDAAQMLLSDGWHWEGEDLTHQSGHVVSDADAWNGRAWMGRADSDAAGWWYGPYFKELPTGRSYRVYFRLKTADHTTTAHVATIDVTDNFGRNTYANQELHGHDFAQGLTYQEPHLDFNYYRRDSYGLEFRTFYTAQSDVYLDRVYLFFSPRSYAPSVQWTLPDGDGRKKVAVRYIDVAGNVSPVYSTTIVLDTAAPTWLGWDGSQAQVRDQLSGLHVGSAEFCTSGDGGDSWGPWRPAATGASEGTVSTASVSAPGAEGSHVRFRIADRAGNSAESTAYPLPTPAPSQTSTRTPTVTQTPALTATASPSPTATPSPTGSHTATAAPTPSPTASPTSTATATATATQTAFPTASPTPTASATATVVPQLGWIRGQVSLQGRSRHSGATVGIEGIAATTTGDSGGYFLPNLPAGTYTVKVQMPGYLEAHREGVTVVVGLDLVLPQVTLRGGDVNGDCDVNLFDLIILSSSYGNPGHDPRADINGDGFVDLRDIVLVSSNLGRRCPGDWGP